MKYLKETMFIVCLLLFINACSTSGLGSRHKDAGGEVIQDSFTIKAGGSYEECIELKPGQVFDYDYDASSFVNFNVHYHTEDGVEYPVKRKGRMMGKGMIDPTTHDFYTPKQEFYCLMWDNLNDEAVKVSFSCVLKHKK